MVAFSASLMDEAYKIIKKKFNSSSKKEREEKVRNEKIKRSTKAAKIEMIKCN